MRITGKILVASFLAAVPFAYATATWDTREVWSGVGLGRLVGNSLMLTLLFAFPVAALVSVFRWAGSGSSRRERFGRVVRLCLVFVSLVLLLGVAITPR
jgi:hypothetical protein